MVFSNSCNPGPSMLKNITESPTTKLKLSSKLENALLKTGLLSPPINTTIDQSPIRKEFYSVINENYSTQQELDLTKDKLNNSIKIQNEQEQELQETKEKVLKLQQKIQNKINEIKESQNLADKYLKKLKFAEDENQRLKIFIMDLKDSVGKMKDDADTVKQITIFDLNDMNEIISKSESELKFTISKLITKNHNEISDNNFCIAAADSETDKDAIELEDEEDSESLHNSSTVSEHSQTSNYYCYKTAEHSYHLLQSPALPPPTTTKKIIPTWLLIISAILIFLSLWIKFTGSLFGRQPHLQIYYTSMPPT